TRQRMPRAGASRTARSSSRYNSKVSALRTSGRLRVMTPMYSSTTSNNSTCSASAISTAPYSQRLPGFERVGSAACTVERQLAAFGSRRRDIHDVLIVEFTADAIARRGRGFREIESPERRADNGRVVADDACGLRCNLTKSSLDAGDDDGGDGGENA